MLCLAPVLRQIWCKKEIFEKITIDNQQVTEGGRALLNPASATTMLGTTCKTRSYEHFSYYDYFESDISSGPNGLTR